MKSIALFTSFRSSIRAYQDRRLVSIFLFGIASGFPWVMIGSAMSAWLKESDLSRSAIGFFGSIFIAYSINFLWSPLLDRIRLPKLGQRRGWILLTQLLIVLCCCWLASMDVKNQLFMAGLIGFAIALSSATQDIAIDAYRIDVIGQGDREKLAAAAAMATAGWWTGFGGLGAIPFFVADLPGWNWSQVYYLLAGIMATLMLVTLGVAEPQTQREQLQRQASDKYQQWLASKGVSTGTLSMVSNWLLVTLVEPFRDFFRRNGWQLALAIMAFIFMFKMGEAFLGRMSIVFYKEIGFSNSDIASYSKLLNWWVTIFFAVIGGLVNIRFGIFRGLMAGGIAMAASNLMFAVIAVVGPNKALFAATIFVDGFTAAWSSVALVAFISLLCSQAFSASQYALMASLGVLGRTLLASSSGFLVDWMDGNWAGFFILTALMVIPSLIFLYVLRGHIQALEARANGVSAKSV